MDGALRMNMVWTFPGLKIETWGTRRVALRQSPTPLHRLSTMLKEKQRLEKTITLNGNCVFRRLSHSRRSPQGAPGLAFETWD